MVGGWLPNLSAQSTSLNHGSFLAQPPTPYPDGFGQLPTVNEKYNATWTANYISEPGMAIQQPYPYFTQSADMGAMIPGNPFLAHTGDVPNGSSQWASMDFTDDMLADFPIVAGGSGLVNNNSTPQFLPPVVAPRAAPIAAPLVVAQTPAAAIVTAPPLANTRIPCTFCIQTFVRDSDRIRHENSKHLNIPGAHLCPVPGCIKSHGGGFSRADKLTEHLWKKHASLGYAKRA